MYLWSKFMAPNESQYVFSIMFAIQIESQSPIIFEVFEKNSCMTYDLGSRSMVMAPNESPYMISYMSTIQTESLSLIVFEIFEKMTF